MSGTAPQRATSISWVSTLNLPDVIREPGLTTDYDYDTYGRLLVTMTQTDTATAATRITTYAYYSNGSDGSGNVILGRLQRSTAPRTDVSDLRRIIASYPQHRRGDARADGILRL